MQPECYNNNDILKRCEKLGTVPNCFFFFIDVPRPKLVLQHERVSILCRPSCKMPFESSFFSRTCLYFFLFSFSRAQSNMCLPFFFRSHMGGTHSTTAYITRRKLPSEKKCKAYEWIRVPPLWLDIYLCLDDASACARGVPFTRNTPRTKAAVSRRQPDLHQVGSRFMRQDGRRVYPKMDALTGIAELRIK